MTSSPPEAVGPHVAPPSTALRRSLGLALTVPALIALIWQLLVPTASTVLDSLRQSRTFTAPAEWAGADNYRDLALGRPLLFGLALAVLPIVAALVVGPIVGVLAARSGRGMRLATRAVIAVPAVFFCPAGLYVTDVAQRVATDDFFGIRSSGRAVLTLMAMGLTGSLGIVCAISATLFLLASSREPDRTRAVGSTATSLWIGAVVVATLVAVGIQSLALPLIVSGGGPRGATTTPALAMLQRSFTVGRIGSGSAISTILLLLLGILGIGVVLVIVVAGLRLVITEPARRTPATAAVVEDRSGAGPAALVGAAIVLVLAVVFARHWLASSLHAIGAGRGHPFLYTWTPAVLGSTIQLVVTGLAAAGIGAFRPLGRHSEWLLLAFAPWLFVGSAPLAIAHFLRVADGGTIGGVIDQLSRAFVNVPALVALTLAAAAAARYTDRYGAGRSGGQIARDLVVPVGAVTLAVVGATVLVNAQRVLWPYLVSVDAATSPAQVALLRVSQQFGFAGGRGGTAELYPFPLIVVFAVLAAVAAMGLDRIALRSAREGVAQR